MILPKPHWNILIHRISPQTKQALKFSLYIFIIFVTGISSAILTQKIYKTPYLNNNIKQITQHNNQNNISNNNNNNNNNIGDYFNNPIGIPLFTYFFGMFYGFVLYQIYQHNNQYRQQHNIPFTQFLKVSSIDVFMHQLLNLSIILISFTTVNLFNCCNLLSVVLVAVFCTKASQRHKVQKRQILIAIIVTVGIILFNIFGQHKTTQDNVNKPLTVWTFLLIGILLIAQGYRPQIMNTIRQKYNPPPSLCYYQISKLTFFTLLIISTITTHLWKLIIFIWQHDRLVLDLMLHGILDMVCNIFIYRIIVCHKQHVLPFVITIRKLLTSIVNIIIFKHQIQLGQFLALGIVASAIILELYFKNKLNQEKFKEVQQSQEPHLPIITM